MQSPQAILVSNYHPRYVSKFHSHIEDDNWKQELPEGFASAAAVFILLATIYSLYAFSYKPYAAGITLIEAISPSSKGVEGNYVAFKKVDEYGSVGIPEMREQLIQIGGQILQSPNVPTEEKLKFAQLIDSEYQAQFKLAPDDARYFFFYGSYLNSIGNSKGAVASLEHAAQLSPRKQQILFSLGAAYITVGEYDKAFTILKTAYESEKSNTQAEELYAAAAIYVGKIEVVQELYGTDTPAIGNIARAYSDVKKFDKAKASALKLVALTPNDADAHLVLASIYIKLNDKQNAILEIKKVIALNPSFEAQGTASIKQLQK